MEEDDFATLAPPECVAEWKWDGIRVPAVGGRDENDRPVIKLYSRTGEDLSSGFPDLVEALQSLHGVIDGELVIMRDGEVEPFAVLQKRINRKVLNAKLLADYPAAIIAYDALLRGDEDLRGLMLTERRAALEALVTGLASPRVMLS